MNQSITICRCRSQSEPVLTAKAQEPSHRSPPPPPLQAAAMPKLLPPIA
jgi:hypothetical protein